MRATCPAHTPGPKIKPVYREYKFQDGVTSTNTAAIAQSYTDSDVSLEDSHIRKINSGSHVMWAAYFGM